MSPQASSTPPRTMTAEELCALPDDGIRREIINGELREDPTTEDWGRCDAPPRTMTIEELFALPDDDIRREIINGELREEPMTRRNRTHSGAEARIAMLLGLWLDQQPEPRGKIHSGEAGFRLRADPQTYVGIDVAYASAELVAATDPKLPFYEGPPVLAVEILSPKDRHDEVVEKVRAYLEAGTVVWVVDPDFRIVRVHRPGDEIECVNATQTISGDPYLPGFRARVAEFFS